MNRKAMGERFQSALETVLSNPYTQAYQAGIDRGITGPIGRRMASDDQLRQGIADMVMTQTPESGIYTQEQIDVLSSILGRTVSPEVVMQQGRRYVSDPDSKINSMSEFIGDQVLHAFDASKTPRADLLNMAAGLMNESGGRSGLTDLGADVRQFVTGSPVAAYAAGGTGVALGGKALMDLIGYLQQNEAAEEPVVLIE